MMREQPGLLVLMGSGETSPTMVEIHRRAVRSLRPGPRAILLDTPYAFQENADDISARARAYFARSVGLKVEVGAEVAGADWVFSGPGSPTYALERWLATPVAGDLRARVRAGRGVTVLASAAACTAGAATVPVYEIYKVGAEPHWCPGLDLLAELDLRAVLIPHYDNAEGGTHDTRYCYLGERRLAKMERELPDGTAVLGVDEHTAVLVDLRTREVEVAGRGRLTVRVRGSQVVLPAGTATSLEEVRRLARGSTTARPAPARVPATAAAPQETLAEVCGSCEKGFRRAAEEADPVAGARAVLDLEAALVAWAADTEEDAGGVDEARQLLRLLIGELGELASAKRVRVLVEPLLTLRDRLRRDGAYDLADALRTAMLAGGITVEDTPDGTRWS
ncbi:hypothetical protein [Nonomuraea sediminis]|uniref:hypothetical protein n=1 Tax=Nonomuraea sediminis TaxID=2835864 RepID=UPI001BDBDB03|nr:hypothetical protein [Nonomuraea sediminis]